MDVRLVNDIRSGPISASNCPLAVEPGYDVTVVKDATADYSDRKMQAAIKVDPHNCANSIVIATKAVETIASLSGLLTLCRT